MLEFTNTFLILLTLSLTLNDTIGSEKKRCCCCWGSHALAPHDGLENYFFPFIVAEHVFKLSPKSINSNIGGDGRDCRVDAPNSLRWKCHSHSIQHDILRKAYYF